MSLNVYSSNAITLFHHVTGMRKRWTLKYKRKKQNSYRKFCAKKTRKDKQQFTKLLATHIISGRILFLLSLFRLMFRCQVDYVKKIHLNKLVFNSTVLTTSLV